MNQNKNATYLGDGVYACFDGYQVWIWTSNGFRESEKIAIEDRVLDELIVYFGKCRRGEASITEVDND